MKSNTSLSLSYAILVHSEYEEIQKLVELISPYCENNDNIVILFDPSEIDNDINIQNTKKYLDNLNDDKRIKIYYRPLNNNFAAQKNYLLSLCNDIDSNYIFNLDADELPAENLIKNIKYILSNNPDVDCFGLPRINIVEGITNKHIQTWNWVENEKGYINFPDYQLRIFKNIENIKWEGIVHEYIQGYNSISLIPEEMAEDLGIYHIKSINKQESQNNFYTKISITNKTNNNISNTGCWDTNSKIFDEYAQGINLHKFDRKLSKSFVEFLKTEQNNNKDFKVVDFGCGLGLYVKELNNNSISCIGYDGNPHTLSLTNGMCSVLDLSKPIDLQTQFDWVISIEVGEHIPKNFESIYIDNLIKHSKKGIILSWATPGQGGDGHVNEQPSDYIKHILKIKGFDNNLKLEKYFRDNSELWWFKNTIMVFEKNNNLKKYNYE